VVEILSMLAHGPEEQTLPVRLCAACLSALPVSGAGVALMTTDGPSGIVLAVTDVRARQLEELQFALGEGPCVDASNGGRPVLEPDLVEAGSPRWPRFGAAVLDAGVRAIFAFPLRVGAIRVGVLDLYRDLPGQLSTADLAEAQAFADAATELVLHLQDHAGNEDVAAALAGSVDNRAVVHQATGMIAIQLGITLAEALLTLRAHAYATKRVVSAVATDVVNRRVSFGAGEGIPTRTQDAEHPDRPLSAD
jgi:hypothetical protein